MAIQKSRRRLPPKLNPTLVPPGIVEIDWTHPLAEGLVACYLPGGAMGLVDLAGNGPRLNYDTVPIIKNGPLGPSLLSTANNSDLYAIGGVTGPLQLTTAGTICWVGSWTGAATSNGPSLFGMAFNSVYGGVAVNYDLALDGAAVAFIYGPAGGAFTEVTSSNITLATKTIATSFIVGGALKIYINGVNTTSTTWTGAAPAYNGPPMMVMGGDFQQATIPNTYTALGLIYNWVLPPNLLAWLNSEPFAMLIPKNRREVGIVVSTGISISLSSINPIEWLTALGLNNPAPSEYSGNNANNGDAFIEWLEGLQETGGLPNEWNSSELIGPTSPVEWLGVITESPLTPSEYLGNNAFNSDGLIEWLEGLLKDNNSPTEWLEGLQETLGSPAENLSGSSINSAAPTEWLGNLAFNSDASIEWLSGELNNLNIPIEWLEGLIESGDAPIEWLGTGTSLAENNNSPIEWLGNLMESGGAFNEWLGVLLNNLNPPVEWLEGLAESGSAPTEYLAALVCNSNSPVEWLGFGATLALNSNSPIEWLSNIAETPNTPVEYSGNLSGLSNVNVEWLGGILEGYPAPTEWLAALTEGNISPNEWLEGVGGNRNSPVEWAGNFFANYNSPVEYLGSLVSNQITKVEWTQSLILGPGIPVENLTGLSEALNCPIEWLTLGTLILLDSNGAIEWLLTSGGRARPKRTLILPAEVRNLKLHGGIRELILPKEIRVLVIPSDY